MQCMIVASLITSPASAQQGDKASIGAEVFDHTLNGRFIEWFRVHSTGPVDITPKAKANMVRIGRLVRGGALQSAGLGTGDFILSVRAGPVAGSKPSREAGGTFLGEFDTRDYHYSPIRTASDLAFVLSQKKAGDQIIVSWSNAQIYPRSFFATVTLSAPNPSGKLEDIPHAPIASWPDLARQSFLDKEKAYAGEPNAIKYYATFDEWKKRFKQDARPTYCSVHAKSGSLPKLKYDAAYKSKSDFEFGVIQGKTINLLTGQVVAPGVGSAIKTFIGMRQVLQAYQAALDAGEIAVVNQFNRTGAISQANWNEYVYWVRKRHLSRGAMRDMSDQLQFAGMPDQAKIVRLFFSGGQPDLWAIPEPLANYSANQPELWQAALSLSFYGMSECSPLKSATTEDQMRVETRGMKGGGVMSAWDHTRDLAGTPERFAKLLDALEHRQYDELRGGGGVFLGGFSWWEEAEQVIAWNFNPPDARHSLAASFEVYRKKHDVEKAIANQIDLHAKYLNAKQAAEDAQTYSCWRKYGEDIIKYRFWSGPMMGGIAQGEGGESSGRLSSPEWLMRRICEDPDHPLALTDPGITVPIIHSGVRGAMHDMNFILDPFGEIIWP
jgi:hypothetical protein